MKIGELSQRSGLTASRIRFYEAKGLLNAVSRQTNGYREYPDEAVTLLAIIARAQQAGFSLDEIRKVMPVGLDHWEHAELVDVLQRKIEDIDKLAAQLAETKSQLLLLIDYVTNKPEGLDCGANAKRIFADLCAPDGTLLAPGAAS